MSYEFRTPLNSILALSRLLLDRVDGELSPEQERQVGYIRRSVETLLDLVNDMLDLSKVEAGKTDVRPIEFSVSGLLAALRGALKPLLTNPSVELTFEIDKACPDLYTDEAKVSQILRNLILNALKFTERGEVRVAAVWRPDDGAVDFSVKDTGIGIADEDQERIFEEFAQVDSKLQRKVKGTGLGLSLSRSLAKLLGGTLTVESAVNEGRHSPFRFRRRSPTGRSAGRGTRPAKESSFGRRRRHVPLRHASDRQQCAGVSVDRGERRGRGTAHGPNRSPGRRHSRSADAGMDGFAVFEALAADRNPTHPDRRADLADRRRRSERPLSPGDAAPVEKHDLPGQRFPPAERSDAGRAMSADDAPLVLNVDDDEARRYVKTRDLRLSGFAVVEAARGAEALRLVERDRPQVVLLDVQLPDIMGPGVCDFIKRRWPEVMVLMTSSTFVKSQHRTLSSTPTIPILCSRRSGSARRRRQFAAADPKSEDDLRALNATLEKKVVDRTNELREINLRLTDEINQRAKAEAAWSRRRRWRRWVISPAASPTISTIC